MRRSFILFLFLPLLVISCTEIKNVDIFVDFPAVVQEDDEFEVIAKLVNTGKSSKELYSIDISDKYLKGITVLKIDPDYKESTHIPIDNSQSYTFNHSLLPGDTAVFKISCKAIYIGDFNGDFDFCIDSEFNFISKNVRTVVK